MRRVKSARGTSREKADDSATPIVRRSMPDGLTLDDINNLKREKQELLRERVQLKTKIARYKQFQKQKRPPERNARILESVKQRIASMDELINSKTNELAQIMQADRSAQIAELQETCRVLYQEIRRLEEQSTEFQANVSRMQENVAAVKQRHSPEASARRAKQLQTIEQSKKSRLEVNARIQARIDRLKGDGAEPAGGVHPTRREIDRLKGLIEEEQDRVAKVRDEIAEEGTRHRNVIASMGLDEPDV